MIAVDARIILATLIIASCLPDMHVALAFEKQRHMSRSLTASNDSSNSLLTALNLTQPAFPQPTTSSTTANATQPPLEKPTVPAVTPLASNSTFPVLLSNTTSPPQARITKPISLTPPTRPITVEARPRPTSVIMTIPFRPGPKKTPSAKISTTPVQLFSPSKAADNLQENSTTTSTSPGHLVNPSYFVSNIVSPFLVSFLA